MNFIQGDYIVIKVNILFFQSQSNLDSIYYMYLDLPGRFR